MFLFINEYGYFVKSINLDYSANDFDRLHHFAITLLSLLVSVHIHCLKNLFRSFANYLQGHTILRCICNNPPHQLFHYDSSRCLLRFNVCLWLKRLQLSALVPLLLTTLIFTILHLLYLFGVLVTDRLERVFILFRLITFGNFIQLFSTFKLYLYLLLSRVKYRSNIWK